MKRPVVAILTDFGTRDGYVAAMKGVILARCPEAALIDITHEVPAHAVEAGAWHLLQVVPYLPDGAVVLGVVDPGVGSKRRAVAIDVGRWRLVGPDNGLFWPLIEAGISGRWLPGIQRVSEIAPKDGVSMTFHGRDVFAPVAGHLACGGSWAAVGSGIKTALVRRSLPKCRRRGRWCVEGEVLWADHFGNLITNIPGQVIEGWEGVWVEVGGERGGLITHFEAGVLGALGVLVGSAGVLEVVEVMGSAAKRLGLGRGARVRVRADGPNVL